MTESTSSNNKTMTVWRKTNNLLGIICSTKSKSERDEAINNLNLMINNDEICCEEDKIVKEKIIYKKTSNSLLRAIGIYSDHVKSGKIKNTKEEESIILRNLASMFLKLIEKNDQTRRDGTICCNKQEDDVLNSKTELFNTLNLAIAVFMQIDSGPTKKILATSIKHMIEEEKFTNLRQTDNANAKLLLEAAINKSEDNAKLLQVISEILKLPNTATSENLLGADITTRQRKKESKPVSQESLLRRKLELQSKDRTYSPGIDPESQARNEGEIGLAYGQQRPPLLQQPTDPNGIKRNPDLAYEANASTSSAKPSLPRTSSRVLPSLYRRVRDGLLAKKQTIKPHSLELPPLKDQEKRIPLSDFPTSKTSDPNTTVQNNTNYSENILPGAINSPSSHPNTGPNHLPNQTTTNQDLNKKIIGELVAKIVTALGR